MSDLLDKVQVEYYYFCNKEYIFYLDNGVIINLKFKKENLPHLIGLHKLDKSINLIRQMKDKNDYNVTPKNIFDLLRDNDITYEDLKNTDSWTNHLQNRMENFTRSNIDNLLKRTVIFTFLYDRNKTKNDKAKYVLLNKKESLFLHLYLGYDNKCCFYYPNSFVAEIEKDRNLSRDNIKVVKTEIYLLSEKGRERIEVIEHSKIREIKQLIKEYKDKNKKFYKDVYSENADSLLKEINNLKVQIINKYNKLNNCKDDDLNSKIQMFL